MSNWLTNKYFLHNFKQEWLMTIPLSGVPEGGGGGGVDAPIGPSM